MSVKIAILKSGEQILCDIKEGFDDEKIITFPEDNQQLDYILTNTQSAIYYNTINGNMSDHYPLIANIDINW